MTVFIYVMVDDLRGELILEAIERGDTNGEQQEYAMPLPQMCTDNLG